MQKIVVMPVKNEAWILKRTLSALSLWADHIILADQQSTDGTRELSKSFAKVLVINNPAEFHSSNVRKLLLEAARRFAGHNAIFSFDADEIPTGDIIGSSFWEKLSDLPTGSAIEMQWVQLWRSPLKYRDDNSVWSNSWKVFGFLDDRVMEYDSLNVINDHTSRVPTAAAKHVVRFSQSKVLHYQFVNWPRMVAKQNYYRITEFLRRSNKFRVLKINKKYFSTTDEKEIRLNNLPKFWIDPYLKEGIPLNEPADGGLNWFDAESARQLSLRGPKFFRSLDIWDNGSLREAYSDPRNFLLKFYHHSQGLTYRIYDNLRAWLKRII